MDSPQHWNQLVHSHFHNANYNSHSWLSTKCVLLWVSHRSTPSQDIAHLAVPCAHSQKIQKKSMPHQRSAEQKCVFFSVCLKHECLFFSYYYFLRVQLWKRKDFRQKTRQLVSDSTQEKKKQSGEFVRLHTLVDWYWVEGQQKQWMMSSRIFWVSVEWPNMTSNSHLFIFFLQVQVIHMWLCKWVQKRSERSPFRRSWTQSGTKRLICKMCWFVERRDHSESSMSIGSLSMCLCRLWRRHQGITMARNWTFDENHFLVSS